MIQFIIALLAGIIAFTYILRIVLQQFSTIENNPKCENCPIPELKKINGKKLIKF